MAGSLATGYAMVTAGGAARPRGIVALREGITVEQHTRMLQSNVHPSRVATQIIITVVTTVRLTIIVRNNCAGCQKNYFFSSHPMTPLWPYFPHMHIHVLADLNHRCDIFRRLGCGDTPRVMRALSLLRPLSSPEPSCTQSTQVH
jgi:hypothetical protein